jgi:26S proteasome regulatory subunit N2
MTRDPVDFVRQGAYISLALILIQQSEAQAPRSTAIRELFAKVVGDKHDDPMARFGASIAQGIVDAGGRNATVSLSTRAGTLNMQAIVGMTLFVQMWYWFPLAHGRGLAFTPTAVIAVDDQLRLPEVEFTCHAKPSTFAYTQKVKKQAEKKEKKAQAAVLSTTAKAQARQKKKAAEGGDDAMDMVSVFSSSFAPLPAICWSSVINTVTTYIWNTWLTTRTSRRKSLLLNPPLPLRPSVRSPPNPTHSPSRT